jgi:hypothetical protein
VSKEVSSPGGSPVAATELWEFLIRPISEAQGKGGVASPMDYVTMKVYTPGVGQGMWGMRFCEI